MKEYIGKSAGSGIALGKIRVLKKSKQKIKEVHIEDVENEVNRFFQAHNKTLEQIKKITDKAREEFGESNAKIFKAHYTMLTDIEYIESITTIIRNKKVNAEYAISVACENYLKMFSNMNNDYISERAIDVKDISNRLLFVLSNTKIKPPDLTDPVIVVADDLTPSETLQLDKQKVLAFVTRHGSSNSHVAILAKTINLPVLFNVNYDEDIDDKLGIVDSSEGILYVDPDNSFIESINEKVKKDQENKKLLLALKGKENVTLDGKRIEIYANIGSVEDARSALYNDAGGIGLFRSEFLYLEKENFPTEEELFMAYKKVAQTMLNKKVIIRTIDIGADKKLSYFGLEKEENPALGYRAIRICLNNIEIFKTQLRAILRAGAFGKVAIMYPMIISLNEVKEIKNIVEQVKGELKINNIMFGEPEQGIMIETPASVMISEELAKEVDFFSIGTNDLTQYTLAIDRQNSKLDRFYDPHHPAIIKMIEMVVKNGHQHNCRVGICGELASDESLTQKFIEIGVDELSVAPSLILPLRENIRQLRIIN